MKRFRSSLQRKFLLSIALIILPTLGVIFLWVGIQQEKLAIDQVVNQARVLVRQIILTRQWVSDCGGIMVLRESEGAKDIYPFFFDDRLDTARGVYQRFTPSMVTKKLSQYSLGQDLYRFRLAGANPLNPENKPDEFEEDALKRFATEGSKEFFRIETEGGRTYFQYMVPLVVDKTCLDCHQGQGFAQGAIGGGLSVFLPMERIKASLAADHLKLAASGFGLILLTVFTLFILLRRVVIRPLNDFTNMTTKISEGDLEARVNISTGDEFERLGDAFNSMAKGLSQSREVLEDRIKQATHELAEANRELQSVDKLKSDFLANMSHELRSPLTALRGGIDYLNRTISGQGNRDYLAIIDKNLSRLIHLVSDLFDFTKIEANKIEWSFQKENVSGLVQEVIEITRPLATTQHISIAYQYPGDIFAEIDLERIEQVLVNLVENAIKFSAPGTELQIAVGKDEDSVLVSVKDQGIGISQESLEAIFEKFHTLPASGPRNRGSGTGLGLAICKGIIQGHGGRIWAESTQGEGSVFYFSLPTWRS
jgi:signal transduction histidine kinase